MSSKKSSSPYVVAKGSSKALMDIGKKSAKKAFRESKAMNLTITYMKDGVLYKEMPDGTKVKVSE